ncbi:MAG: NADH-quinone oxidoreductase subunit NuoF [Bacilli bacterium]|nr:NADH-quinone oxidoreductase subunit NuoF [Bacilli bacterium]
MNITELTKIKSDYLATNPIFNEPKNVHPLEHRIVLKNYQIINPEEIVEYISKDGYFAFSKAITMSQSEVIEMIIQSNLRGRGGVGFPTGLKWKFTLANESDEKYVICNADEGEPGTFMDRHILEGDPHSIIEGMMIAGYAIGASKGYIYVRAEYPLAAKRLQIAIDQAKDLHILGTNIFETKFSFEIEIRLGAGAFICGEETALMESIEGKRGLSRNKPPFPAENGLFGKPTVINNVETLANVPFILLHGPDKYKELGTEKSSGTKVFSLSGKIKNGGIYEVPMGITLNEIIYKLGGGMKEGSQFHFAFSGGPSGGVLREEHLHLKVDFDSLIPFDSIMGSGGIIIFDQNDCVIDTIKLFMEFNKEESCGKCTPCREGTGILFDMLDDITGGTANLDTIDALKYLGRMVQTSSLCGLGQAAPNPIFSTLRYFKDEFVKHIEHKSCSAGICTFDKVMEEE